MRKQTTVKIIPKAPLFTKEEEERRLREEQEVQDAMDVVRSMAATSSSSLGSPNKDRAFLNVNKFKLIEDIKPGRKLNAKTVAGTSKTNEEDGGGEDTRCESSRSSGSRSRRHTQISHRKHNNQIENEMVDLDKFDGVVQTHKRINDIFSHLMSSADEINYEDEEDIILQKKKPGEENGEFNLKLNQNKMEEIANSMAAMAFEKDLMSKDPSVKEILELKDDFIERAFQSRVNESRIIQKMYDKFKRYRKIEEEKFERRLLSMKGSGNVDALEAKLSDRMAQKNGIEKEIAQKEKFLDLIKRSGKESSYDQIRAMLELSAQEEVEESMKVLEVQQGQIFRELDTLNNLVQEGSTVKSEVAAQFSSFCHSDSMVSKRRRMVELNELEGHLRKKFHCNEQDKTRVTSSISKALKTILVTSLKNESYVAKLALSQKESADIDDIKKMELKINTLNSEIEEEYDKQKTLNEEETKLAELERIEKEKEESEKSKPNKNNSRMRKQSRKNGSDENDTSIDLSTYYCELFEKSLGVDKNVKIFLDKETIQKEEAEEEAKRLADEEDSQRLDNASFGDIALGNVNFAIKLGYKGKDQKTQDRMKLQQGKDYNAEKVYNKDDYKSYGLNAVLEQVEAIFNTLYIDPEMLQAAENSDDDECDDNSLKDFDEGDYVVKKKSGDVQEPMSSAQRLLRRQATQDGLVEAFEKKFAKQPVLNKSYEDVFRNKDEAKEDIAFDPNRRRDAEQLQSTDVMQKLGVDAEGNCTLKSKEEMRKELLIAKLEQEMIDCTKITTALCKSKRIVSKVDSNYKPDKNRNEEEVEMKNKERNLDVEFAPILHESPSFELGVDVYRSCEELTAAIKRRREAIANVKGLGSIMDSRKKLTKELLEEKTDSRNYAYETFMRNLHKLETVKKDKFRFQSALDIEKGEILRDKLKADLQKWKAKLQALIESTEYNIAEQMSVQLEENECDNSASVKTTHEKGSVVSVKADAYDPKSNSFVENNVQNECNVERDGLSLSDSSFDSEENDSKSDIESKKSDLSVAAPEETENLLRDKGSAESIDGDKMLEKEDSAELINSSKISESTLRNDMTPEQTLSEEHCVASTVEALSSERSSEVYVGEQSLEKDGSVFDHDTVASETTSAVEQRVLKEAVRVMLSTPGMAPDAPDGHVSRATSSRLRRFRYSGELKGIERDALDNTIVRPDSYGPNQELEQQPVTPLREDLTVSPHRLNTPRSGRGPYSPVPHIEMNELVELRQGEDKKALNSVVQPIMGSDEDNDFTPANYFVPKSKLLRGVKKISCLNKWKQVAERGGIFQKDGRQSNDLSPDALVVTGGAEQNDISRRRDESAQGVKGREIETVGQRMDSFWPESLNVLADPLPKNSDITDSSEHFAPIPSQLDSREESNSSLHDNPSSARDRNDDIFPRPKRNPQRLNSAESEASRVREAAIEKTIITRKIARKSAWDRVVGMKTSFMKKYIQQEFRDPRIVRVINAFQRIKAQEKYQDRYEYSESSSDEESEDGGQLEHIGEGAMESEERRLLEKKKRKKASKLKSLLRRRVHEIIKKNREEQALVGLSMNSSTQSNGPYLPSQITRVSVGLSNSSVNSANEDLTAQSYSEDRVDVNDECSVTSSKNIAPSICDSIETQELAAAGSENCVVANEECAPSLTEVNQLIMPPSPVQHDPQDILMAKGSKRSTQSVQTIGDKESLKYKTDDLDMEGEPKAEESRSVQHAKRFPYQPPPALKSSRTLSSPRHKSVRVKLVL